MIQSEKMNKERAREIRNEALQLKELIDQMEEALRALNNEMDKIVDKTFDLEEMESSD